MKVDFTTPPRTGHRPHLDGRTYLEGWKYRRWYGNRNTLGRAGGDDSFEAGWFDADNAIRLGRDIGQPQEAPCE